MTGGVLAEFIAEIVQAMQRNGGLVPHTLSLPRSGSITCCVLGEEDSDESAEKAMENPPTEWEMKHVHSFRGKITLALAALHRQGQTALLVVIFSCRLPLWLGDHPSASATNTVWPRLPISG